LKISTGGGQLIDRAARTLCYVFANRLLFYESVRRKFDELKQITVPKKIGQPLDLLEHLLVHWMINGKPNRQTKN
jgi:hypothetical protein